MSARVLHFIPSLGSGGAERQLSLLAPAMVAAGATIGVAYGTGGPNLSSLQASDVETFSLPARSHHDPRVVLDLRHLIRAWRPDLVQTWIVQMDVFGGLAARWTGVPWIVSERCSAELYGRHWKTTLRHRLAHGACAVIANSEGGVDHWRALGFQGSMHVVRNGVSPPNRTTPSDTLGLDGHPLLLAVGRLSEQKNIGVLVDALGAALARLPTHHALILGDGPLRAEASQRIEAGPARGRIHLGGVSGHVGYWLGRADAFVSASLFEGHPNVVIEAASAGCPMVVSDIVAHREVVDEHAALYAAPTDMPALAEAIVRCVDDRPAARERAERARAAVAGLTFDAAAARYLQIYAELLKR